MSQLLRLTQALEERERWTLQGLEAIRLKEVRTLEAHEDQRRKARETFADRRREGSVTSESLAMQAEFLQWSRRRDHWHIDRIEAAASEVDAQREVFLAMMNRRKTTEKVSSQLNLQTARTENRRAERKLDEWVIQRWGMEAAE